MINTNMKEKVCYNVEGEWNTFQKLPSVVFSNSSDNSKFNFWF